MADKFVNWPPPVEALFPLVRTLARAAAQEDFRKEQAFLRSGRHLRRSFSPVDPEPDEQQGRGLSREAPTSAARVQD